jgi:hypothetical protein
MSVLDPFEVFEIEVWPLPHLQESTRSDGDVRQQLDALERLITTRAIENSQFKAILNEKDPPAGKLSAEAPPSFRGRIVSERVFELRSHPDFRLARRALILSRLAQVISERKVQGGLRRVLLTQAKRAPVAGGAPLRCSGRCRVCRARRRRRRRGVRENALGHGLRAVHTNTILWAQTAARARACNHSLRVNRII